MDLNLTGQQQAFREEVRGWLEENAPREPLPAPSTEKGFRAHRAWERRLYEAGYAAIHWPAAYGGRDASIVDTAVFQEEYARAGAPSRINVLGLGLAGPTLIQFGSDEQKARWLPGILSCDDIWCQGFSEPDAGSDLANLRTSAVREGDEYIVNGQKVWTSQGRHADWIFALVRTARPPASAAQAAATSGGAPGASKHQGITFLMIDMHSPGIEVRPLVQINGDAGFAEVFFTDVRVPVANVVGAEHDGWRVAMATLGFERGTGLGTHVRFSQNLAELVGIVREMGLADDPLVRDEVARLYAETEVYRHHMYRTLTRLSTGRQIGPEASLNKLYWSEMEHRIFDAGMRAMGPYAELGPEAPAAVDRDRWQKDYWYSRAACIYAGTSEIQKNIIAERVLGLPKEARR